MDNHKAFAIFIAALLAVTLGVGIPLGLCHMEAVRAIREDGFRAGRRGAPPTACPYSDQSPYPYREEWLKGWLAGDEYRKEHSVRGPCDAD